MSLFCFLWLQIPAEFHSKNSPPQEVVESFLTSQKWHCRPHYTCPLYPRPLLSAVRSLRFASSDSRALLPESAQDLKFRLVSFVKRIFSLPGADTQQGTALLIVRRKAWRDAWSWLLSSIQYSQMYPVGSISSGYPFFSFSWIAWVLQF